MKGIYIGLPVWGAAHIALWHEIALPAMLAPGNLPLINRISPATVLIYTNQEDRERIEALPLFGRLCDTCTVEFTVIGKTPDEMVDILHPVARHGGTCFKNCQNMAIKRAWEDDCGYTCWSGDTVWSNTGGAKIEETLNENKRALMYVGYGLGETFIPRLKEHLANDIIDVSPNVMSCKFLDTMGGGLLPRSIDEPNFGAGPGNLRWSTGDGRGMLVRPHHVNIGFIYPERGPVSCGHGVDHEMAQLALTDYSQVFAVLETHEHMVVSVNALGDSGPPPVTEGRKPIYPPYSRELVAIYLKVATSEWHRHWMRQCWWCHGGDLPPTDPVRLGVELDSDSEIFAILRAYDGLLGTGGMTPELQELERKMQFWDW